MFTVIALHGTVVGDVAVDITSPIHRHNNRKMIKWNMEHGMLRSRIACIPCKYYK